MARKTLTPKDAYQDAHELVLIQDYDGAIKLLRKHKDDKHCRELLFRTINLKKSIGDLKSSPLHGHSKASVKVTAGAVESKSVTVSYGIFNNPNKNRIEKAIKKWGKKGFRLVARNESKPGCLMMLFTLGWARGKTELTFVKD